MNEFLIVLAVVLLVSSVVATLRDIHDDNPRRRASYQPPQSHPGDPFGQSGHSFH